MLIIWEEHVVQTHPTKGKHSHHNFQQPGLVIHLWKRLTRKQQKWHLFCGDTVTYRHTQNSDSYLFRLLIAF